MADSTGMTTAQEWIVPPRVPDWQSKQAAAALDDDPGLAVETPGR